MYRVYLDNNATTRVDPQVVQAMLPYFTEQFGNASSKHAFGTPVAVAIKRARQQVQGLIGAESADEIVFTSGGTESDNTAILAALESQTDRNEVVTTMVEHPAILSLCDQLENSRSIKVIRVPVDGHGRLDLDAYRTALGPKTAIASVMWANNETGTLFDVAQLAGWAHEVGAWFHTDAVQAAGKVRIDVRSAGIDLLSLSAHKFHGPKGIGALYVRKGIRIRGQIIGGRQERGRRAGTENVPAIIGFGKAAEFAQTQVTQQADRIGRLRDRLETSLAALVDGLTVFGDIHNRVSNTSSIAFEDVESDALLTLLDQKGIAASAGSACASGSMESSHVLRAMRVPFMLAHGAVRFSLSNETTHRDIDAVLEILPPIITKLRTSNIPETTPESAPHGSPPAATEGAIGVPS